MTTDQIKQAFNMHEAGIKYDLIAAYFKLNTTTLRKHMRKHEETNSMKYTALLERAEATTNRREAIKCIRESTKIREQIAEYSGLR